MILEKWMSKNTPIIILLKQRKKSKRKKEISKPVSTASVKANLLLTYLTLQAIVRFIQNNLKALALQKVLNQAAIVQLARALLLANSDSPLYNSLAFIK